MVMLYGNTAIDSRGIVTNPSTADYIQSGVAVNPKTLQANPVLSPYGYSGAAPFGALQGAVNSLVSGLMSPRPAAPRPAQPQMPLQGGVSTARPVSAPAPTTYNQPYAPVTNVRNTSVNIPDLFKSTPMIPPPSMDFQSLSPMPAAQAARISTGAGSAPLPAAVSMGVQSLPMMPAAAQVNTAWGFGGPKMSVKDWGWDESPQYNPPPPAPSPTALAPAQRDLFSDASAVAPPAPQIQGMRPTYGAMPLFPPQSPPPPPVVINQAPTRPAPKPLPVAQSNTFYQARAKRKDPRGESWSGARSVMDAEDRARWALEDKAKKAGYSSDLAGALAPHRGHHSKLEIYGETLTPHVNRATFEQLVKLTPDLPSEYSDTPPQAMSRFDTDIKLPPNMDLFGLNEPDTKPAINMDAARTLAGLPPEPARSFAAPPPSQPGADELPDGFGRPTVNDGSAPYKGEQPQQQSLDGRPQWAGRPAYDPNRLEKYLKPTEYYRPPDPPRTDFMARLGRGLQRMGEGLNPNIASANMARAKAEADVRMKMLEMDASSRNTAANNVAGFMREMMQQSGQDNREQFSQANQNYRAELAARQQGAMTQAQGWDLYSKAMAMPLQTPQDYAIQGNMLRQASAAAKVDFTPALGQTSTEGALAAQAKRNQLQQEANNLKIQENTLANMPLANANMQAEAALKAYQLAGAPVDAQIKMLNAQKTGAEVAALNDPVMQKAKRDEALAKSADVQRRAGEDQFAAIQKRAQMGATLTQQGNAMLANIVGIVDPNTRAQAQRLIQQGQRLQQEAFVSYQRPLLKPAKPGVALNDMGIVEGYKMINGGDLAKAKAMAKADGWILPELGSPKVGMK